MQEQNLKDIVNWLLDRGYTQTDLAKEVNVSQMAVSLWSRGKSQYTNYNRHLKLLKLLEKENGSEQKITEGGSGPHSHLGCETMQSSQA